MRNRLIELHEEAWHCWDGYLDENHETGKIPYKTYDEYIADYLLENGVIVPPCKVGDTVWAIIKDTVRECQIHHYKIFSETLVICFEEKAYRGRHYEWSEGYVGVALFETKEEAEQALSKLQASYEQIKGGAE